VDSQQASPAPTQSLDLVGALREVRKFYAFVALLIVGVMLMIVGVAMAVSSDMGDNPNQLSAGDIARGGVIVVAGVAVILLGWWYWRPRRRSKATASKAASIVQKEPNRITEAKIGSG
jgi:hypothetical protein